jgi:hypothetical protein
VVAEVIYAKPGIQPRVWQVLAPLGQIIQDKADREGLEQYAYDYTRMIREQRDQSLNGEVVAVLLSMVAAGDKPSVKAIAAAVIDRYHDEGEDYIKPFRVAKVLTELGVKTTRRRGGMWVNVEASKEALELARKQYPPEEEDKVVPAKEAGPTTKRMTTRPTKESMQEYIKFKKGG